LETLLLFFCSGLFWLIPDDYDKRTFFPLLGDVMPILKIEPLRSIQRHPSTLLHADPFKDASVPGEDFFSAAPPPLNLGIFLLVFLLIARSLPFSLSG